MDIVHPWDYKVVVSYIDRFKFANTSNMLVLIFHKTYAYTLLSWNYFIWKTIKYDMTFHIGWHCVAFHIV